MLAVVASGCGTIANLAGQEPWLLGQPPEREVAPFGGVDNDVRWMSRGLPPNEWMPWCIAAAAIDTPLSLAGDIITLPVTVPYALTHPEHNQSAPVGMHGGAVGEHRD
jgi:hypothetical protein